MAVPPTPGTWGHSFIGRPQALWKLKYGSSKHGRCLACSDNFGVKIRVLNSQGMSTQHQS
eukprot:1463532-Karenia_brevis.AAC.1